MDFETMMGPIIYQDIPSSFGLNPMPTLYGGYPIYGAGTVKPALQNDKFEKIEQKNKEAKHTFKKVLTIAGSIALAAVALKFGKKCFNKLFPKNSNSNQQKQNLWTKITTRCTNTWNRIKNFFKPAQPPTP